MGDPTRVRQHVLSLFSAQLPVPSLAHLQSRLTVDSDVRGLLGEAACVHKSRHAATLVVQGVRRVRSLNAECSCRHMVPEICTVFMTA